MFLRILILLFVIIASSASAKPSVLQKINYGYFDFRKVILMHPLMHKFDFELKRFKNTGSEPRNTDDTSEFIARLTNEAVKIQKRMTTLDNQYVAQLKTKRKLAQKNYWLYWEKRQSLKFYLGILRSAVKNADSQGSFFMNMSSDWSIMPVVDGIIETIRDLTEYLKKTYKVEIVLDSSVFKMPEESDHSITIGHENRHWGAWNGRLININEIKQTKAIWQRSIRKYFPEKFTTPFVAGAVNMNETAERLMRGITLPNNNFLKSNKGGR